MFHSQDASFDAFDVSFSFSWMINRAEVELVVVVVVVAAQGCLPIPATGSVEYL